MTTPPNHNTADQSGADERAALYRKLIATLLNFGHSIDKDKIVIYANHGDTRNAMGQFVDAFVNTALAFTQAAQAVPAAWIATIQVGGGPEDPPDYDVVAVPGDTKPDDRNNWTPLYATPQPFPAPAVQSGDADLNVAVNVFESIYFSDGLSGESSHDQIIRAMRAALISSGKAISEQAAQAVNIPHGYKLVPMFATESMAHAAQEFVSPSNIWIAMVNAAPPTQTIAQTAPAVQSKPDNFRGLDDLDDGDDSWIHDQDMGAR